MVKSQKSAWIAVAGLALALTSCHEDVNPWGGDKQGTISPLVTVNSAVESSRKVPASRATTLPSDISVEDLSLKISSTDGSFSRTWNKVTNYEADTKYPIGQYVIEAWYGNVEKEGFNCPAFYASQEISVRENETSNVSLTATLQNSMVSIEYTDAFKKYMTDWDANIHSDGGQYVYYAKDESRPGYLAPGAMTMNVWFTKPNGTSATLEVAKFNAQARHHYHMTVDLNNGDGGGNAILVIKFDETLAQEDIQIELSDELMESPAPELTGSADLENGSLFTHVVGDQWTHPLKVNVVARGGVGSIKVTTRSKSLIAQGWPSEVDLATADANMQGRLKQLGFNAIGLWGTSANGYAVLDFTDVINSLTESDDVANNFTIAVVDKMGKTCDPFSFAVNTTPLQLQIENPSTLGIGDELLSFDLIFNGKDPQSNVKFQYSNDRGTWTSAAIQSVEPSTAHNTYRVTVKVPGDSKPVTLRAVTTVKNSESITVSRVIPEYGLTVAPENIWAKRAAITVTSTQVSPALLASSLTLYISENGGAYSVATTVVDEANLTISGLKPGTKYTAKASVNGNSEQCCTPVEFTTEAATDVPNGNFESLATTLTESSLNQGGQWSISLGVNYQSTLKYTIQEPTGWASVNAKTTSGSTRNSWFVVPAVFNSTLEWSSTVPKIHVVGVGGGTETPDSYKGFIAYSGSNAMVIRNVAWDPKGSVPGVWKKEFASTSEYYNHNEPEISQVSVGKLFLGSYSYNNGTETYNEGTAFASRPTSLSGWYTYKRDAGDNEEYGTVKVQLLNGNTVIGTGEGTLTAADTYTQFTVNIKYVANAPKATSLRIMLTSSQKASYNQADETSSVATTTFMSRYESAKHGATLTVDNLSFNY